MSRLLNGYGLRSSCVRRLKVGAEHTKQLKMWFYAVET
jgi:hypothetical protein